MSQVVRQHKAEAPERVRVAVITVSDTRTLETDTGGLAIVERLRTSGHELTDRRIMPDDPAQLAAAVRELAGRDDVDAVLITGGTGLGSRDQTYETIDALLTKALPGYGELFRWLSYAEIGAACMLSRAVGGLVGRTVVLTMPGSPAGVALAMDKVILPELGHLVREARR